MAVESESFLELYHAYKDNTKYVLDWLWSNSASQANVLKDTRTPTTQDIINAAILVSRTGVPVPPSVISSLSEAIEKRTQVGQIYHGLDPATRTMNDDRTDSRHRVLQIAFDILSPLKRSASVPRPANHRVQKKDDNAISNFSNRFGLLKVEKDRTDQDGQSTVGVHELTQTKLSPVNEADPTASRNFILKDDDIAEWIEIQAFIRGMKTLLDQLKTFWKQAADNEIPLTLAAWLSQWALRTVEGEAQELEAIVPDARTLFHEYLCRTGIDTDDCVQGTSDIERETGWQTDDYEDFYHAHLAWQRVIRNESCAAIPKFGTVRQEPSHFVKLLDDAQLQRQTDDTALEMMLVNIQRIIDNRSGSNETSDPLDFENFLRSRLEDLVQESGGDKTKSAPIHLIFGLELLISSYKSFIWASSVPNKRNCRIELLQFAQEFEKDVSRSVSDLTVYAGDTDRHAALQRLAGNFRKFYTQKRSDLYAQSPLNAGCLMIHITQMRLQIGLWLCSNPNYVCAALHLYNALRSLEPPIGPIAYLDELCELFKETLFLGSFPKENFSSHYRRARGQGLSKDRFGKRILGMLLDTAASSRNIPVSQMSIFGHLISDSYCVRKKFWEKVTNAISAPSETETSRRAALDHILSSKNEIFLERCGSCLVLAKDVVLKEFTNETPILRINFFAIFRMCLQLTYELAPDFSKHPDMKSSFHGLPSVDIALIWIDMTLKEIVERSRNPLFNYSKCCWKDLDRMRKAFANFEQKCPDTLPLWEV